MEAENSWLERKPLKNLCRHIRRSLAEAAKLQEEQSPQSPATPQVTEEESSLTSKGSSSKISFECGYAMFSEKHSCWILRHRGTTVAPTSLRKQHDSFDSLSCTGTSSSSTTERPSSLPLRNARRVAGIWPSEALVRHSDELIESANANYPTQSISSPPIDLLKKVLRAIELRSMFEQVRFSLTKDSPGPPQCLSRMGRTKIDFAPMLSYMCDGRKSPTEFLQEAVSFCSILNYDHDSWVVKVDAIEELKVPHCTTAVPKVLAAFINHCLAEEVQELETNARQSSTEDNTTQSKTAGHCNASETSPRVFLGQNKSIQGEGCFESRGAQLPGERSTPAVPFVSSIPLHTVEHKVPNQQPGQPSMASFSNGEETRQILPKKSESNSVVDYPFSRRTQRRDEKSKEGLEESRMQVPKGKHNTEHIPETRASKRRKTQDLDQVKAQVLRSSEDGGKGADAVKQPNILRRSVRTLPTRWVEDGPASPVRVTEASQETTGTQLEVVDEKAKKGIHTLEFDCPSQDITKPNSLSSSHELHRISSDAANTTECPSVEPLSLQTQSSGWIRLSHLGHVSDYHGFERKYAFLPLRWDKSLGVMSNAVEDILRANHFEERAESDEEVVDENKELERQISRYSQKAKTETNSYRPPSQQYVTDESASCLISRPIVFDHHIKGPIKDRCPNVDCSLCSAKSEATGLHRSENQGTFREVEFDPLDLGTDKESNENGRRSSRSKEIVTRRKASLLMLNELRHTFQFISNYNKGFGTKPSQPSSGETEPEANGSDSFDQSSQDECSDQGPSPKRKKPHEQSQELESKLDVDDTHLATEGQSTEETKPSLAQLPHLSLIDEFLALKRRKIIPLFSHAQLSTVCDLQESVNAAVNEQPVDTRDEDMLHEQKAFIRALRTYSGKADQERIEKTKHEEERILQFRELEYRNRGKKPSAEEAEFVNLENRPALFNSLPETQKCKVGESCNICAYHQDSTARIEPGVIFHPTVKRVDDNYFTESAEPGARRSRTLERSLQRELAIDTLVSLQHRINFVGQYNQGWIVTNKRRN